MSRLLEADLTSEKLVQMFKSLKDSIEATELPTITLSLAHNTEDEIVSGECVPVISLTLTRCP